MDDKKMPKNAEKFYCELCDFKCSKESNWNKHLLTRKHKTSYNGVTNDDKKMPKNAENAVNTYHECACGNIYKYRQGLWKHQRSCSMILTDILSNDTISNSTTLDVSSGYKTSHIVQIVELLLAKNNEFISDLVTNITEKNGNIMEKMIEIMPNIGNQSHNTMTNSHNTQNFNIQMFLNEHCKNAMNLTDFIDSLPITAETYDNTIQNGLTKTLTNMITNGLSQLDILERPIHCTDATRKTLYVKEANNWEKDTELLKILLGIKQLARKQRTMISEWKDVNEGWEKDDNIQTKLTTLICHSMTDIENDEKETSKIIRAISKNVYLDNEAKQQYIK